MIIPDANILLYAHIPFFKQHRDSKLWLENSVSEGRQIIGLAWQVITAFVRISTNRRKFRSTAKTDAARNGHINAG